MNNIESQGARTPRVRNHSDLPFASQADANNLAKHFLDKFLLSCRTVTDEEAVMCLSLMVDIAGGLKASIVGEQSPISQDIAGEVVEQE